MQIPSPATVLLQRKCLEPSSSYSVSPTGPQGDILPFLTIGFLPSGFTAAAHVSAWGLAKAHRKEGSLAPG